MNYIYGYRNKINNKWYIGQTTMKIEERHRLHLSGAFHKNASDYNCLFHQKIREYGVDNFELIILEEVENKEDLDEKEQYWINEKQSFVKQGNGYNLTIGGQRRKDSENYWDIRCLLSKEQALEIIEKLKNTDIPQTELAKEYNVHVTTINSINYGNKYRLLDESEYPIREKKQFITDEAVVENIINLLQQGYGNVEIVKIIGGNLKEGTVAGINSGAKHKRKDLTYPIRKETNALKQNKEKAEKIKILLEEGKLNNKEIANIIGCDPSVVSRINSGKTYPDSNRSYPIRK